MGGVERSIEEEWLPRFLLFPYEADTFACDIVRQIAYLRFLRIIGYNLRRAQPLFFRPIGKILSGTSKKTPPGIETAVGGLVSLRMSQVPFADHGAVVTKFGKILGKTFFRLGQPVMGFREIVDL